MVRIKFTGPVTTVRSQHVQAHSGLASNGTTSAQPGSLIAETHTAMGSHSKLGTQETEGNEILQQQQSLEMVKIMLHVTLGTLFYLREFLPLPCFDERDLKKAQKQQKFSYQEFINNNFNTGPSEGDAGIVSGNSKRSQPLKIILRGSDPKADMIVDVLETGIFDALSKSVLEALQLTIVVDKEAPENVLESYTFSFKYTKGLGHLRSRLESLSIEPFGYVAAIKSAQTARVGLESIVRRLITLSSFLPTLPNKRTLGIHLFYTEDCPPDYEPPGFTGSRDGFINYPLTENWRRESQTCGRMDGGWHTVGLKVTSLKWVGSQQEASESLPQIPEHIEYKDAVPRIEDIGFEGVRSGLQSSQSAGSSQEASQDVTEREKLQMMMPSQEIPSSNSDLIPTQPTKPAPIVEGESTENSSPSQKLLILSRTKIAEIRKNLDSQDSGGLKDHKAQGLVAIRCHCDWDGEGGTMIECDFCHTRQHILCYGYEGAHNIRVPDVHACYQCLLEPNESQVLDELKTLVLARRALRVILDEGFPSHTSLFAEKLHCSGQSIVQITNFLRKEGLLQPTHGYKAKGFMRKGLPKFSVPESQNIRQIIEREIMDPMVKIKHHYTEQYLPERLESLSPPATSEVDNLSKPKFREKGVAMDSYEAAEAGTYNFNDRSVDTPQKTHGLRSRTTQSNTRRVTGDGDQNIVVLSTAQPSNKGTPRSTRKRMRSSQVDPEPYCITPSQSTPDHERVSEGPRRSGRKRRKISNYSKLIDVGAETSGNERV